VAWFLLTLGGMLYRLDVGLMIGGISLAALTVFVALRFGVFQDKPLKVDPNLPQEDAKRSNGLNVETLRLK
jgi:hypothetical protein